MQNEPHDLGAAHLESRAKPAFTDSDAHRLIAEAHRIWEALQQDLDTLGPRRKPA
jgi:hypothetical protein